MERPILDLNYRRAYPLPHAWGTEIQGTGGPGINTRRQWCAPYQPLAIALPVAKQRAVASESHHDPIEISFMTSPIFQPGDLVRPSALGASRIKKARSTTGPVPGTGKASKLTIRVLSNGMKCPVSPHQSYLELDVRAPDEAGT
jgi:hypothetical protein